MTRAAEIPNPKGSDGAYTGAYGNPRLRALSVKLDVFDGPLDLLLFLIKRDEIDITDIPIAKITSEYLSWLKLLEFCDLEIAGEYILMAATLIRIKSAMLLPRDPEADDEEDPREELIQALLEYRRYKEAAGTLKKLEETERVIYARTDFASGALPDRTRFVMDRTLYQLLTAFRDIVARVEPETFHRVEVEDLTVDQRIVQLDELLDKDERLDFAALFLGIPSRWLIILTFLALLEMARTRRVKLIQSAAFDPLVLTRPTDWTRAPEVVSD